MVRGAVVIVFVALTATIYVTFSGPLVEHTNDAADDFNIDHGQFDGTTWLQGWKDALLIWVPLIMIAGSIVFAARWYLQLERRVRRR